MSCDACYEIQLPECENISITTQFAIALALVVTLQKPGSAVTYQRDVVIDAQQKLNIPITDFPAGLFVAGSFFNLSAVNGSGVTQPFVIGDVTYPCLLLKFVAVDDGA